MSTQEKGRMWLSASQGESSLQKLTLLSPCSWTFSLCEKINFFYLSHGGVLLWQPKQINRKSIWNWQKMTKEGSDALLFNSSCWRPPCWCMQAGPMHVSIWSTKTICFTLLHTLIKTDLHQSLYFSDLLLFIVNYFESIPYVFLWATNSLSLSVVSG